MKEIVELELPDGEVILAEALIADSDIGALERFKLDEVKSTAVRVASWAHEMIEQNLPRAPDRVGVTIGLRLVVQSGVLTSLLASAAGEASITVTLEWDRHQKSRG